MKPNERVSPLAVLTDALRIDPPNGVAYVCVLPGNQVFKRLVDAVDEDIRTRHALEHKPVLRGITEIQCAAKSWKVEHRGCARIKATFLDLDIRFVVTDIVAVSRLPPSGRP